MQSRTPNQNESCQHEQRFVANSKSIFQMFPFWGESSKLSWFCTSLIVREHKITQDSQSDQEQRNTDFLSVEEPSETESEQPERNCNQETDKTADKATERANVSSDQREPIKERVHRRKH